MRSKKIFWGLIFLFAVLLPLYAQYDSENDFETELSEDRRSVRIIEYLGNKQNVSIPPSIKGLPVSEIGYMAFRDHDFTSITIPNSVTRIGDWAFRYCTKLTSITIPESVTGIGEGAFGYCLSLTGVTIGKNVTQIEYKAFLDCRSLTAINVDVNNNTYSSQDGVLYNKNKTILVMYPAGKKGSFFIPNNVQSIRDKAFYQCKYLTSVTISDSVKRIGDYAFYECIYLTDVIIGNSVTEIGEGAFRYCKRLTSVTIGNSVIEIGEGAFKGCISLTAINVGADNKTYSSQDGVLCNKNKTILVMYPMGKKGSFLIPNNVQSIGDYAFSQCNYLTSVTIPDSVKSIGDYAFQNCINLTDITIPDSVISIGDEAFAVCVNLTGAIIGKNVTKMDYVFLGCASLTAINVDVNNKEYSSQDGVLYNKNKTILYQYPAGKKGPFVIMNSVLSIGDFAFLECVDLTDVIIGNNVVKIGDGAFYGCIGLKKVIIPNKVKTIGAVAFRDCNNLTAVIIGNSVTEIGERAFYDCISLTKITIPKSVKEIGETAFYGCESLVSVIFEGKIPSDKFDDKAFLGDLRDNFYATDTANGTTGTYTTAAPVDRYSAWTRR